MTNTKECILALPREIGDHGEEKETKTKKTFQTSTFWQDRTILASKILASNSKKNEKERREWETDCCVQVVLNWGTWAFVMRCGQSRMTSWSTERDFEVRRR